MTKIPLLIPSMPSVDQLVPWLRRIDNARWYTNFGPLVTEFEQQLLKTFPASDNLSLATVSSGTTGLELALLALNLPQNSRVLIPSFTFVATATAVLRAGLTPVAADVDPKTWLLTPEIALTALKSIRFDAVMPVSTFGCPQSINCWNRFIEDTGVPVVIDAAGALGNQAAGKQVAVVFSLHATKALGIGEGGIVVSANHELVQRIRRLSNFGINPQNGISEHTGSNGKMSEYHAAVGLAALHEWPTLQQRRRDIMQTYLENLEKTCPDIVLQDKPKNGVYSVLALLLPENVQFSEVVASLAEDAIETRRWYAPPIHRQPCFAQVQTTGRMDVTDAISSRILGVPFHLHMSPEKIRFVCSRLAAALHYPALDQQQA